MFFDAYTVSCYSILLWCKKMLRHIKYVLSVIRRDHSPLSVMLLPRTLASMDFWISQLSIIYAN